MGQNLCCMKQPIQEDEPKDGSSRCGANYGTPPWSISSTIIEEEKRHLIHPTSCELSGANQLTLEECLMASPKNVTGGGDQVQVVQMLYQKICPSSPDVHTEFFTPKLSFSPDKLRLLGKVDEEDDEGSCESTTGGRSSSGKVKKRVSFKLPDEADIIIFYSPKNTFEEF